MGSGRRKVSWTLCFLLLLLLEATSTKNLWKRALPSRLAERSRLSAQAEEVGGSHQPRADRCPPPPRSLPPGACQAARCQADSECPRHRRCCYNGCAYACLEAVPPPPVLDWLVQPKPRWLGGNGWLLDGPEEVLQAEACSTTEDGAEPLLCPSGYECHILSPGDLAAGIPNRGQCVKQRKPAACQAPLSMRFSRQEYWSGLPFPSAGDLPDPGIEPASPPLADGRFLRQKFYKEYPEGASKYVAEHGQGQQRHFQ
ncbi:WAP four-disulfide core domain protein 1 isoform 1-T1 [Dama dama]|uniref:WAP four-disulfide core domain protein 1 isoform X1 n=1 Tax=Dama dama TaxID=30532 RepID=UPI002A36A332|nr:WAP four-disulfide core domain protein 1 isoform X1 [Dama dama]XP_060994280.1 WAP four-disulfide core domain protein 1 isoform X1 [Dama dama]